MDKKTSIIVIVVGIVIFVAIILAFVLEQGTSKLTSNDVLRINQTVYHKDEYEDFIKYTLYKNNGEMKIDDDGHDHTEQLENGASQESIFLSDCLDEFYQLKVFEIVAEDKNIEIDSGETENILNDYDENKDAILSYNISKERYLNFETLKSIRNMLSNNPSEYLDLPDGVYDDFIKTLSGDDLKSYSYRIMQVGYTEEEVSGESGETIMSGDKEEKQAYMDSLVNRIKSGEAFEVVAESGDTRIISSNGSYSVGKSALENSAGVMLEQKISMFTGNSDLSDAIKKTASGELTEIIDTGNSFQIALVEGVEDGIVGASKEEVIQALINELYNDIIYSYVYDMEANQSVLSRIKIQ